MKEKDDSQNPAEIESLVGIFRGWVSGLGLSSEMMLRTLFFRLKDNAGRIQPGWISAEEAQRWQSREGMTHGEVIADSRPRRTMPEDRCETGHYLSYLTEWFVRWSSRLIPDQETRRRVVGTAEWNYLHKGRNN